VWRERRRGEGCGEAFLEVRRVFENLGRELRGSREIGRNGAREEWSGGKPDSERVEGRKYLFGCAVLEEIERARCSDYC